MQLDPNWTAIFLSLVGGFTTWVVISGVWALRQSGRIDLANSEMQRLADRVKHCEDKAVEQQTNAVQLDNRLRSIDSKLSRLMGRLGMPVRSGDDMEVE